MVSTYPPPVHPRLIKGIEEIQEREWLKSRLTPRACSA